MSLMQSISSINTSSVANQREQPLMDQPDGNGNQTTIEETLAGNNNPPPPAIDDIIMEDTTAAREHNGHGQNLRRNRITVMVCFGVAVALCVLFIGILVATGPSSSSNNNNTRGGGGNLLNTISDNVGLGTTKRTDFALLAEMTKSPDYEGPLEPSGNVHLLFDDDNHFLLTLHMKGLEVVCNGCRVKVHSHSSCAEVADNPGVPFWNHQLRQDNPWEHSHYFTEVDGTSHTALAMYTGHGAEDLENRVVLVYNRENDHVACGVLAPVDLTTRGVHTLQTQPHNHPIYQAAPITGTVRVQFFPDDTFVVHILLDGLPPNCDHCGIGIQEGTDCHRAYQGSHLWDRSELDRDPFQVALGAYYNSDENGHAERSFFLYNGYNYRAHFQHALVVKDQEGKRIGCGLLAPRLGSNGAGTLPAMAGQE